MSLNFQCDFLHIDVYIYFSFIMSHVYIRIIIFATWILDSL